jgi:hypothetical protein
VPVLLILVSVVILVGVVAVAIGRGGEMAEFAGDYPPFVADDLITAADVALVHPPSALWGYNVQATEEALGRIAQVITERDVEIAGLRQQLAELGVDPVPANPVPAKPVPANPVPVYPVRADSVPADSAPADSASADSGTVSGG